MIVAQQDYSIVMEDLLALHKEGLSHITYPEGLPLKRAWADDVIAFDNQYDAVEFCHDNTSDRDIFNYQPVWPLYRAMEKGLEAPELLSIQGGMVDLSALVRDYYQLESETIKHKNKMDMNQKNLEYLQDQVKYTGFGEGLSNDLKQKIEKGGDDFKLQHSTKFGNDTVEATLNFSKSKQSEMYFFNSYNVSLQKDGSAEKLDQTFYINKGNNITLKEAYNLMEGRSVHKELTAKEGEKYNSWVQLDFKNSDDKGNFKLKHYHENYGYDLEAAVSKHPIKELGRDDFKDSLMDSLKKGNVQSVTFQMDGKEQKHFIEANPQFKTVNVYDSDMQRLGSRESKSEKQSQGESQDNKRAAKTGVKDAEVVGDDAPKADAKKKRGQKV